MVEPTALMEGARVEESQRVARAFERLWFVDPLSFYCDADPRETKTCSSNACDVLMTRRQRRAVHASPIGDETCLRISLFPEVTKRAFL